MIHFDFEDRHSDELVVGRAINRRDGVVVSVIVHSLLLVAVLYGPDLDMFRPSPEELEEQRQALRQPDPDRERRFVFVDPQFDMRSVEPPKPEADLSDLDRRSAARERLVQPSNPEPLSRGNTFERTEAAPPEVKAGPISPLQPNEAPPKPEPEEELAQELPRADRGIPRYEDTSRPAPGRLGDALRNLERYVQNQTFNNPLGGATDPGSAIQFDTKGVEFGPWVRRFVAQVKRNWFIPQAAMTFRGRVVLQFNVHKDGRITDLVVAQPSNIEAFTRAAFNSILGSNPTTPLPPEYPEPMAFFTVTFYYNEQP